MSIHSGPETRVNTNSDGSQNSGRVTALADGGWVVTWQGMDGPMSAGVFQQRYDSDGSLVGGETQVSTYTSGSQGVPEIVTLDDGGWVVVWRSVGQVSGADLYEQRYDANGDPVGGETQVNSTTGGSQQFAGVIALDNGGWLVDWEGPDANLEGVFQQAFDAAGDPVGTETLVNTETSDNQFGQTHTALSGGRWVETWSSVNQDGSDRGIYQQIFSADGSADGAETKVNTTTTNAQTGGQVATLADGGWLVTWHSNQNGLYDIYQQRFAANGTASGGEVLVNTYTTGNQTVPQVTALSGGGWVVTWQSDGQVDGTDIYQQVFDAAGTAAGPETQVNDGTDGGQTNPKVLALANGGWVTVWMSDGEDGDQRGIYQQVFAENGTALGGSMRVNEVTEGDQQDPRLAALDDGGWVVTWQSGAVDAGDVEQRVFHLAPDIAGVMDAALVKGGQTVLDGSMLDIFDGYGGDDVTIDVVSAGHGHVAQAADPGTALTSVSPADLIGGNLVYVQNGKIEDKAELRLQAADSHGQVSDIASFEVDVTNVQFGSPHADHLKGGAIRDYLYGRGGADVIKGGNGNDQIIGGGGRDVLKGGQDRDTIRGSGGRDKLLGQKGNDKLFGNGGNDHFVFKKHDGRDKVMDFRDHHDRLDLKGFHFHNKHQALHHFSEMGGLHNDWVKFDAHGTHIKIHGVDLHDISGADILI